MMETVIASLLAHPDRMIRWHAWALLALVWALIASPAWITVGVLLGWLP